MAKKIKIISVGKIKKDFWKNAQKFYWKRLSFFYSLEKVVIEPSKAQSINVKIKEESQKILKKIKPNEIVISLDEKGEHLSTKEFSMKIKKWLDEPNKYPCFIIGGSYGLGSDLKRRSNFILSLGKLTLPHELAHIIFLEQLYRASCLLINHPYHH